MAPVPVQDNKDIALGTGTAEELKIPIFDFEKRKKRFVAPLAFLSL
jgi:hypothetical protein